MKNVLFESSKRFATEIDALCDTLVGIKGVSNTLFQLKKSSSSVFANVSEAQYPQSLPDMLSKFKIARKECIESESWLNLLFERKHISYEVYKEYRNMAGRIRRLLTSSCLTIERKTTNENTPL